MRWVPIVFHIYAKAIFPLLDCGNEPTTFDLREQDLLLLQYHSVAIALSPISVNFSWDYYPNKLVYFLQRDVDNERN